MQHNGRVPGHRRDQHRSVPGYDGRVPSVTVVVCDFPPRR